MGKLGGDKATNQSHIDHEISGELDLAVAEWVEQQSEDIHVNRKTKCAS
jgi:hypothetical protein